MKVLVVGGSHPNERQATKVFNYLRRENDNPKVSYELIPFTETMQGYMNRVLKLLLSPEKIERRLSGGNKDEGEISRQIIYLVRDDLKKPKVGNRKKAVELYTKLEDEMNLGGEFFKRFPEFENALNETVQSDFLMSIIEKHDAEIGVDIHNCKVRKSNYRPFIFDVPKNGDEIGLNQLLIKTRKKDFLLRKPPKNEDPFYGIEIPADYFRTGFSRYALVGLMFSSEDYYQCLHDPNLPNNLKNFDFQKDVVKSMIDAIATFQV